MMIFKRQITTGRRGEGGESRRENKQPMRSSVSDCVCLGMRRTHISGLSVQIQLCVNSVFTPAATSRSSSSRDAASPEASNVKAAHGAASSTHLRTTPTWSNNNTVKRERHRGARQTCSHLGRAKHGGWQL